MQTVQTDFTLYTLHSTLYTLHSALCTFHFTLHTRHFTLHTFHFTLHTPHFALYTLRHSPLYTLHSALYTPHSTLHTLHFTLYTLHFTHYTPHFTLYTTHSTLGTAPSFAFNSLHCTCTVPGEKCRLHSGSWTASWFFWRLLSELQGGASSAILMQSFGLDGEMVPDFSAVDQLYSSLRHGKNISSILGDNIPMILGIIARRQRFFFHPFFFEIPVSS